MLVEEGGDPESRRGEGLGRAESGELEGIVDRAIADNPDAVEKIRPARARRSAPIVGAVMRETKGRADGGEVQRLIRERLGAWPAALPPLRSVSRLRPWHDSFAWIGTGHTTLAEWTADDGGL